jgi:O-antigen/teichoic acid export membrane protein
MFPLVIAVGVLANDIIPFLFGRTWADVGPVAQMLSVMVVPFTLNYFIGCATAARGAPQAGVSVAALQLVLTVILSYLAAPFGLIAVAAAFVLRSYLVLPYQQYVLYKYTGVDPIRALRSILPPLVSAVVMGGSMIVLRPVIHAHCEIPQIYIGVQIASSATSYVVCLLLIGRAQLKLHLRALFDLARRS